MSRHDTDIEQLLLKYRPADAPAGMRHRVLASRPRRTAIVGLFRAAVAAMLIAAFGLQTATRRMDAEVVATIGLGPVVWTDDAEEVVAACGSDAWVRRYVQRGLMAGPFDATSTNVNTTESPL